MPEPGTDAAGLRARASRFLAAHDPKATERVDFLRARFHEGLAWVHFPVGLGGLDAPRVLQPVVDAELAGGQPLGGTLGYCRSAGGMKQPGGTVVDHASMPC